MGTGSIKQGNIHSGDHNTWGTQFCTLSHDEQQKTCRVHCHHFPGNKDAILTHTRGIIIPPPNEVGGWGGILDSHCPSVCLSVRPSVCRRHGFRSISQVSFGISISIFICMLMVAIGRSLSIFSDVTFKMAAWRPYWIFWFPDSNFTLALNINFKLQRHNTYVYG